jgi:predicted lipoprotein with Yx(FWY)xxD motif
VTRGRRIAIGIASGLTAVTALTWLGIQELGANQAQSGPGSVTNAAAQAPVTVQLGDPSSSASGSPAAPTTSAGAPPAANALGPAQLTATEIPKMGSVIEDSKGFVLYRFDKDTANPPKSNCVDTCALIWPPVLTNGTPTIAGVDPSLVGTVARPDGTMQVTLHGWPLYNFSNEKEPGKWAGQAVGKTWWVIDSKGAKNLTCVPSTPPPAPTVPQAPPAADNPAGGAAGTDPNAGAGSYGSGGTAGSGTGGY